MKNLSGADLSNRAAVGSQGEGMDSPSPFPAYPEYKDSRVEWLDTLPAHWEKVALKWVSRIFAGGTPDKTKTHYWENGSIPWLNSGAVNQVLISEPSAFITTEAFNSSSARWIPSGSLVMALAGQGKTKGMVAQLAIRTTCNQSMAAITPVGNVKPRYLFWWLSNNYQNIRNMAGGDLRDGLNLELIGDIPALMPSEEEQNQIARFLDHETARIDALIEEQQRLIELLKEKRQAVISHAVTKGLDPTVPMKDSGVEWLGEVPAHWERKRLKNISPFITVGIVVNPSDYVAEEGLPFIYGGEVKEGLIEVDKARKISLKDSLKNRKTMLEAGDIVTMRVGYPGLTAVVPPECEGGNCASVMLVKRGGFDSRWLCAVMNSRLVRQQVEVVQYGAAQKQFNIADAIEFWMFRPPLSEQAIIAEFVEEQSSVFDELAAESENSMALLQERRSALISAAVTGKIDVRGWQPSIVKSTQYRKAVEA